MQAVPSSQYRASDDALDIFIIAGEESGDRLGAGVKFASRVRDVRPAGPGGLPFLWPGVLSVPR